METRTPYWRSLDEKADTPEFREMVRRGVGDGIEWENLTPTTRRNFLQVMGASLALAGLAGCRWPKETIVPFARPAGYVPGVPQRYATMMEIAGVASGLVVTSYDGRPIKVDGNPEHPQNRGASDLFAQASILGLYDPARSRSLVRRDSGTHASPLDAGTAAAWDAFDSFIRDRSGGLRARGGAGLAILSEASSSPSLAAMRARLREMMPGSAWVEYESVSRDNERAGTAVAFGRPMRPVLSLDQAEVIVCLDEDLLCGHPAAVAHARDFAAGRRAAGDKGATRLYSIESAYTITGGKADHRFAVPSRLIPVIAGRLAAEILKDPALAAFASHPGAPRFVSTIARDLERARGRSLVVAGPRQPAHVHALAHAMNGALGNIGRTIRYIPEWDMERPSHISSIARLAEDARAGRIDTLLILGGNPLYDAPADVEFAKALAAVPASVHLSLYEDETSRACSWHLPRAHYLESWGDARSWDGTIGITQPLIDPLYGGKSPIEVLSVLLDDAPANGHDIVRRTMRAASAAGMDFETSWRAWLNDGFIRASAPPLESPSVRPVSAMSIGGYPPGADGKDELEVVFVADAKVHDGRFAGNAWLQEMPDPMTKITWDNAALMSPATAAKLDVRSDDLVHVRHAGREIEIPAYVMPGIAAGSVILSLGYGRAAAGPVGSKVGADVQILRTTGAPHFDGGITVARASGKRVLATTQSHHVIDLVGLREMKKRVGELIRETDAAELQSNPDRVREEIAGEHGEGSRQLFAPPHDYAEGHRWGMAIDLDACSGCGACMIACQAENNVPVVGRDQIRRGREMHWLRVDRYFSGDEEDPGVSHQPLACVQCENAPCEQVCPVGATSHSSEGLNEMVYNRCIGTRYCSNNCPYKVRRFNWFNFHRNLTQIEKMMFNPDVTVRSRGVMEKCTFCVQRIEGAKIRAREDQRAIADGEIVPACAQACPSRAIVFGDLNDPRSRVLASWEDPRAYSILGEINTRPRTHYLAKVKNKNPDLEANG